MNRTFSGFNNWSVKLIIINTAIYFLSFAGGPEILSEYALIPASVFGGKVWQIVSYMFLHGNLSHLFFNMYALLVFGIPVEQTWGSRNFLIFYFFAGIGAGLTILVMNGLILGGVYMDIPTLGASGAIFGVLTAFGFLYPDSVILLFFVIPLKAKYLVILYGAITFWAMISGDSGTISHAGHLGGLIFGLIFILIFRKKLLPPGKLSVKFTIKPKTEKQEKLPEKTEKDLSSLAEKLITGGQGSLSDDEFQEARYLTIMTDTEKAGMCDEKEFEIRDSYCMECEFYRECTVREIKKRMPGEQS